MKRGAAACGVTGIELQGRAVPVPLHSVPLVVGMELGSGMGLGLKVCECCGGYRESSKMHPCFGSQGFGCSIPEGEQCILFWCGLM